MKCALCSGEMILSKTNLPYELGEEILIVIKDVPALVCQQCGDHFINIQVVRELEDIVAAAERDGVTFGVVKYRKAA